MIDIIIVNWNSGIQLSECVASVHEHGDGLVRSIIIVDNASSDGSLENLDKTDFPICILRNEENYGFGAACNQGAAIATAEFILFLNPDTMIFDRSLSAPHDFMTNPNNGKVGICGVKMVDEEGKILRHCAKFPTPLSYFSTAIGLTRITHFQSWGIHMTDWDHKTNRNVDHVIGAFYFVRRSLFNSLSGFDGDFFVYLEDLDFSYRANMQGWRVVYLADAKVFHACGGTSRQVKSQRLFYSLRSRLIYAQKHFSSLGIITLYLVTLCIEPVARLVFALVSGHSQNIRNVLRAYGMLISSLPQILVARFGSKTSPPPPSRNARE